MQEILQEKGRSKCKDFIEITDANYAPCAPIEETVTEVIVTEIDGKLVVTENASAVTKTVKMFISLEK